MKDSSAYKVLARKYRPQKFSDVIGQEAIVATLKNAILMNRVAHAYLFCGSRGTGKTTLARLFAKALNCLSPSQDCEPCNQCPSCKDITSGHANDVIEIDGASHRGIEDIRKINETIGFVPTNGHYKIILIDEVHMLTKEAFNALLKTLEEPPGRAKFFFATTEVHKIPATILSRCQRFNLNRISKEKVHAKLKSITEDFQLKAEDEALFKIAELSEGSLRDAEVFLDQVMAFQTEKITLETVSDALGTVSKEVLFALDEAGKEKRYIAAFEIADQIFSSGKNTVYFLEELILHFRALFLLKQKAVIDNLDQKRYSQSLPYYREEQLLEILDLLIEAQNTLKFAPSEKTALEMILLKILRTHQKISLESLVKRLEDMEKGLSVSEDPIPKPHELPSQKVKIEKPSPKSSFDSSSFKDFKKEFEVSSAPKGQDSSLAAAKPLVKKEDLEEKKAVPKVSKPESEPEKNNQPQKLSVREQSHFDTVMHFAAKELNGSLKKEP